MGEKRVFIIATAFLLLHRACSSWHLGKVLSRNKWNNIDAVICGSYRFDSWIKHFTGTIWNKNSCNKKKTRVMVSSKDIQTCFGWQKSSSG